MRRGAVSGARVVYGDGAGDGRIDRTGASVYVAFVSPSSLWSLCVFLVLWYVPGDDNAQDRMQELRKGVVL